MQRAGCRRDWSIHTCQLEQFPTGWARMPRFVKPSVASVPGALESVGKRPCSISTHQQTRKQCSCEKNCRLPSITIGTDSFPMPFEMNQWSPVSVHRVRSRSSGAVGVCWTSIVIGRHACQILSYQFELKSRFG